MKFPDFFQFHLPTRVLFGPGLAGDFSGEMQDMGGKRAFIVTEKILEGLGIPDRVRRSVEQAGLEIAGCFDEVVPNSEISVVEKGARMASEAKADRIIAVGGGSSIDTAKCINLLLCEGGNLLDYQGAQVLSRPLSPLIAVPTTAGTGSEVTMVAVISDRTASAKISFVDRHLTPHLAVLDPELTLTLPRRVTAATGMDALTHAIEAYVDVESSPFSDAIAAQAMKLVAAHLTDAVVNGENVEARSGMLIASMMAGVAFNHSMVGVVHGMAHALGGICHVAHGEANAIMLPYGMEYNLEVRERKYAEIAGYLGVDTRGMNDARAATEAVAAVRRLTGSLHEAAGFPVKLSETGVPGADLEAVAALAMTDGSMFYNPREVVEAEVLAMLQRAH